MYTLCLQRDFIARHRLVGGDWGPENDLHAHPYRVEVRLSADDLDRHGYLVDLDRLETVLEACTARYRDRVLNDLPEFQGVNPSIEHFARRFFDALVPELEEGAFGSIEVRIWENRDAWASYRKTG